MRFGPFNIYAFMRDLDSVVTDHVSTASVRDVASQLRGMALLLESDPETRERFGIKDPVEENEPGVARLGG